MNTWWNSAFCSASDHVLQTSHVTCLGSPNSGRIESESKCESESENENESESGSENKSKSKSECKCERQSGCMRM